ncbi:MAG: hypothetical protein A2365_00265 [Candidatus Nealsonbacteria bacterium RIFOXYB1_FULL_40_15]|uniref:Band 7 domain-containing protein n=1 Tax=Candidatus Nealsonbacteria bacterium RIFOXYB1_FULL_40_15 TaxID=1801677 RepID=A0A1G2ENI4_9BACT|nr:MAG: hypothetical protein A2365_00265 [Candidatus Nealsonbacteria bacterium RIFOXYB1_FULL_40_15]
MDSFWKQKMFWVWVVLVVFLAIFVPIIVTRVFGFTVQNIVDIFPLDLDGVSEKTKEELIKKQEQHVSLLALAILLFVGFLAIWYRTQKHFIKMLLVWVISVYLLYLLIAEITINQLAIFSLVWLVAQAMTVYLLYRWGRINFDQCGSVEKPAQAVVVRLGKDIKAVGPGLYFTLRPLDRLWKFPTATVGATYNVTDGVYSRADGTISSQPITGNVSFHFTPPDINTPYNVRGQSKTGGEILRQMFRNLPAGDFVGKGAKEAFVRFFKLLDPTILGGFRQAMIVRNSDECRHDKAGIERDMKVYVSTEDGNPLAVWMIPMDLVDFEVKPKIPDAMEEAYMAPEIAAKKAEASKKEADAIKRKLVAVGLGGGDPDAFILVDGLGGGKGPSAENVFYATMAASSMRQGGGSRFGVFNPKKP